MAFSFRTCICYKKRASKNRREKENSEVKTEDNEPSVEDFPLQMVFYNREGYQTTPPMQFSTIKDIQSFATYAPEEVRIGEDGQPQPLINESFLPKKENQEPPQIQYRHFF